MAFETGRALLIGVSAYENEQLRSAPTRTDDARELAAVLRDPLYAGYLDQHITLLPGTDATRATILAALHRLATHTTESDTVLVFYSGHGAYGEDNAYYLATRGTELKDGSVVAGSGLRESELLEHIQRIRSRQVVLILNVGHAEALAPPAAAAQFAGRSLPERLATALLATGDGRVIMTACRPEQQSHFAVDETTTVFTRVLIDGLRGRGLGSRHGYISVFDLYDFVFATVSSAVRRRWGLVQEPELVALKGTPALAVALYRGQNPTRGLGIRDRPAEPGAGVREIEQVHSQVALGQTLSGHINLAAERAIAMSTSIGRDQLNLQSSQGAIIGATSSTITQTFGNQRTIYAGVYVESLYAGPDPSSHIVAARRVDLEQAEQLLATLPLDRVPDLAGMQYSSGISSEEVSKQFVDRGGDLRWLARRLKGDAGENSPTDHTAVVKGIGGIGKTELARQFVQRYGPYFAGGVFWLRFVDPQEVPRQVATFGSYLGLSTSFDTLPIADQVQRVRAEWEQPVPRLLVFDAVDDEVLLQTWRPRTGGCRVLVTTRRGTIDVIPSPQVQELNPLDLQDSITLLHSYRPDLEDTVLQQIAEAVEGLPLALNLAGKYLQETKGELEPQDYLQRWFSGEGEKILEKTFGTSYERLDVRQPVDKIALDILQYLACFTPGESISRGLLRAIPGVYDKDAKWFELEAVQRLVDLGLVGQDVPGSGLRLHRVLRGFVRARPGHAEAQAKVEELLLAETNRLLLLGLPAPMLVLQPHLRATLVDLASRRDVQDRMRGAALSNNLGYHLFRIGDYQGARPYVEQSLQIREALLGPMHPDTATSLDHLAQLLFQTEEYPQAREYYERALTIRRAQISDQALRDTAVTLNNLGWLLYVHGEYSEAKECLQRAVHVTGMLGPDDPETARTLNNLGWVLKEERDYTAAQQHLEQACTIRTKVLGENHPDSADSLTNLGFLLILQARYDPALEYLERALTIRERVLGPDHPDTATTLNDLGVLFRDRGEQGDYDRAREYFERALELRSKLLGRTHRETATTLNNIGWLYYLERQFSTAQPYLEQALAARDATLGPDHPETATTFNDLGVVLQAQRQIPAARRHFERALEIREHALGSEHPAIADTLINLAWLLYDEGKYDEARSSFERALAIRQKVLGEEHRLTAECLNHIGFLLYRQHKYDEAQTSFERALQIRQKVLPEDHLDTATTLNDLGSLLRDTGSFTQARHYLERAVAIRTLALSENNPLTATSLNNLAYLYFLQENYARARPLFERALKIREKVLDPNHPDIAVSRIDLAKLYERVKRIPEAVELIEQALPILNIEPGPEHPETRWATQYLANLQQQMAN